MTHLSRDEMQGIINVDSLRKQVLTDMIAKMDPDDFVEAMDALIDEAKHQGGKSAWAEMRNHCSDIYDNMA